MCCRQAAVPKTTDRRVFFGSVGKPAFTAMRAGGTARLEAGFDVAPSKSPCSKHRSGGESAVELEFPVSASDLSGPERLHPVLSKLDQHDHHGRLRLGACAFVTFRRRTQYSTPQTPESPMMILWPSLPAVAASSSRLREIAGAAARATSRVGHLFGARRLLSMRQPPDAC